MDKKQIFLLWYVVLAFTVLVPLREFIGASHTPNLSYSEFKQTLAAGQVGDVVVKEGVAVGLLKADGLEAILPAAVVRSLKKQNSEPRFLTILLNAPDLMAQLGAPFLSLSGPDFVEMPVCVGAAAAAQDDADQ